MIFSGKLAGSGSISVKGLDAPRASGVNGGGGAGGTIAIYSRSSDLTSLTFDISGGSGSKQSRKAGGDGGEGYLKQGPICDVDLINDPNNCGGCGVRCSGQCINGHCARECPDCYTNENCQVGQSGAPLDNTDIFTSAAKKISCEEGFAAYSISYKGNMPLNWYYPINTATLVCKRETGRGQYRIPNSDLDSNARKMINAGCECDESMVGIVYYDREIASTGDWATKIFPICEGYNRHHQLDSSKIREPPAQYFGRPRTIRCPEGQVVTTLWQQEANFRFGKAIDGFTISCAPMDCAPPFVNHEIEARWDDELDLP